MKLKQMKNKKMAVIATSAVLIAALAAGGISAFFTSTDDAANEWTVGNVSIDLVEDAYDKTPASDRKDIVPNQPVVKDPVITNTGTNDAYVFLRFSIPKANVRVANADGTAQASKVQELFSYQIDSSWVKVSEVTTAADKNTYVYAYGTASAPKVLAKGQSTPSLFVNNKLTFINVIEGQGLEGTTLEVPVESFGIQTTDLNGKATSAEVWNLLIKQVDTK